MATTSKVPVFDADNHLYETQDALTKFLPDRYKGVIDYVDVRGRTKIVVRGQISDYIPNPTFEVVARPGAQEEYYRKGNPDGKSRREIFGEPMRAIPAFRKPASRLELMDEQGIERTLMFPTLASLVEERMRDDPELIHAVVHALNQWMYETWQFNYEDRIFTTPVITLPIVEKAHRGARLGGRARRQGRAHPPGAGARLPRPAVVRPARVRPVLGEDRGARPPRRHALLRQRLRALHERVDGRRHRDAPVPAPGVPDAARRGAPSRTRSPRSCATAPSPGSPTSRWPWSRTAAAGWRPLLKNFKDLYKKMPQDFLEDPVEASGATSTSARSGKRTRRTSPSSSVRTTCSTGPTTRTPRASPTRPLHGGPRRPADDKLRKFMGGNLARLMNMDL